MPAAWKRDSAHLKSIKTGIRFFDDYDFSVVGIDEISAIFTDDGLDEAHIKAFEEAGVRVVIGR